MGNLERETTEIPCPKCSRAIKISYRDMFSRREAKCSRCGSKYKFNSSDASNLRSKIKDFERSQDKFGEAVQRILKGADIEVKR